MEKRFEIWNNTISAAPIYRDLYITLPITNMGEKMIS